MSSMFQFCTWRHRWSRHMNCTSSHNELIGALQFSVNSLMIIIFCTSVFSKKSSFLVNLLTDWLTDWLTDRQTMHCKLFIISYLQFNDFILLALCVCVCLISCMKTPPESSAEIKYLEKASMPTVSTWKRPKLDYIQEFKHSHIWGKWRNSFIQMYFFCFVLNAI